MCVLVHVSVWVDILCRPVLSICVCIYVWILCVCEAVLLSLLYWNMTVPGSVSSWEQPAFSLLALWDEVLASFSPSRWGCTCYPPKSTQRNLSAGLPLARLLSIWAVSQLSHSPALSAGPANHSGTTGSTLMRRQSSVSFRKSEVSSLLNNVPVTLEEKTVIKTASLTHVHDGSSLMYCGAHYVTARRPQIHSCPTNVNSC